MKLLILLLSLSILACAQQPQKTQKQFIPPQTHWQSFGFKKQPNHAQTVYYKSDSLGYGPVMAEVISFNKEGYLIQKYIRIIGEYGSETAHNYVYTNGLLDSINTVATSKNFNSQQKLHYNKNGQLTHIISTGKFANFTDSYTYEDGVVATIERKWASGGSKKCFFKHDSNYIREKETALNGSITENYTVYNENEIFASFKLGGRPVVTFYNAYHRADVEAEVEEHALNYVLEQRKLKKSNPETFNKLMGEMMDKPSSKVVFDIPVVSTNEDGDWIKRLQVDRRFSNGERQLVFRKLVYADGAESGDTEFDMIFDKKVERFK